MHHKTARVAAGVSIAALAASLVGTAAQAEAGESSAPSETENGPSVVYSTIAADEAVSPPSIGYHARSTMAVGDIVALEGDDRLLDTITVSLNSWACEDGYWNDSDCVTTPGSTFDHPVTIGVHAVEGEGATAEPGALLYEFTRDVTVPFRPTADHEACDGKQWYDADAEVCHSGLTFYPQFDLSDRRLVLPDTVAFTVSVPTSKTSDIEEGPAKSLNINVPVTTPHVGADIDSTSFLVRAINPFGSGELEVQGDWGNDYTPSLEVTARAVPDLDAFLEDFENESSIGGMVQSATGEALVAAAGCYYGAAPITNYGTHGTDGFVNTRYAGYASVFPEGGYTASADFYLDADADEGQFSWSHALNGTDGLHQRDFVFHAGADGAGSWTIGVANGANGTAPYVSGYGDSPATVTESGWYTFQHTVRNHEDLLTVDLTVLDAAGHEVATWTLGGNEADVIPTAVGGNRYGWLVNNSYENLPIDNVLLNAERPTDACPAADFTGLDAARAAASGLVEAHYTGDSFAAVTAALDAANAVDGATVLDQGDVDAAAAAIVDAIDALELLPADIEALQAALTEAGDADRDGRTPESLALLDAAIVLGEGALDAKITAQAEVDAAVSVLTTAIAALDYLPANLDALNAALDAAGAVDRVVRTSSSRAELDAAVEHALELLDANITEQHQVTDAATAVLDAIDALEFRPANTTALASAIAAIDAVDLSRYTVPTVERVTTALAGAEALLDADVRAQSSVDAKAFQLRSAYAALKRVPSFSDVSGSQFKREIRWFAAQGITTGYSDGTFRPLGTVNRDAMAAFLYRWAGKPAYTPPARSPFADVPTSQQFYKEIAWLAEQGISTGWSVGGGKEFRPYEPIDRNAMAAFLYRFADVRGYTAPRTSPFLDVDEDQQFYKEMAWLAEEGISNGWSVSGGKEFRPYASITRDAMAAFLYRMAQN